MFETVELGTMVRKPAFKREVEKLRIALLETQRELAGSNVAVALLLGGVEGAGKTELANRFLEWMDARGIQVHALGEPSDEERERPRFWRFWRMLPPRGKMGIFVGSWYTEPIVHRVFKTDSKAGFDRELDRIVAFEKMLSQENVLVLKFWLHLSKGDQKKRLRRLEKDADTRWRVTKTDWKFFDRYDRFRKVSEQAIARTSTAHAPWHLIDAGDERHRTLAVVRTSLQAIRDRIEAARKAKEAPMPKAALPKPAPDNILSKQDLSLRLTEKEYEKRLLDAQRRVSLLARKLYDRRRSMILVFEGPDAAGKGGSIRRLTQALDARNYRVISVAAPTDEERAHPYLWRFWRNLPRLGRITIYDRSWYGRVLVERLEGFCRPEDWQRAYAEINAFEAELADFGTIVGKFWIAISPEEQLRRFKDRQQTPFKQYKITEEDWRNREKWDGYLAGACDMIERTSTETAPWTVVAGEDKRVARVQVVETVARRLESEVG
jgi:polyphosphate:AMP phosphotransferase